MAKVENSEEDKPLRGSIALQRGIHAHIFVARPDPALPPKPILDQKVSLSLLCHFSSVVRAAYGTESPSGGYLSVTKTIVLDSQFQEKSFGHLLDFMKACCLPIAAKATESFIGLLGVMDCFHLARTARLLGVKGVSSLTAARMDELSGRHVSAKDVQAAFLVSSDTIVDEEWQQVRKLIVKSIAREAHGRGGDWQGMDAAWVIKMEPVLRKAVESEIAALVEKEKKRQEKDKLQFPRKDADPSATGDAEPTTTSNSRLSTESKGSKPSLGDQEQDLSMKYLSEDGFTSPRDNAGLGNAQDQPDLGQDEGRHLPYKYYDSGGRCLGGDNTGLSNDYLNSLSRPSPAPETLPQQIYEERNAHSSGRRLGENDETTSLPESQAGDTAVERRKGKRSAEGANESMQGEESPGENTYRERYGSRSSGGQRLGE